MKRLNFAYFILFVFTQVAAADCILSKGDSSFKINHKIVGSISCEGTIGKGRTGFTEFHDSLGFFENGKMKKDQYIPQTFGTFDNGLIRLYEGNFISTLDIVGSYKNGVLRSGTSKNIADQAVIGRVEKGFIIKEADGLFSSPKIIGSVEGSCSDGEMATALLMLNYFKLD